jgi:hypothetical protein
VEYQNGTDPTKAPVGSFEIIVGGVNYDTWLPEFGKVIKIQAKWKTGTKPSSLNFVLTNTSIYPGRAVNDPDPAKTATSYPVGYDYNGFDFGLATKPSSTAQSYAQGPMSVTDAADGLTDGFYTVYLHCWDYGGRTKLTVSHPTDPNIVQNLWIPKGSEGNGIGSAWQYDNGTERLNANADIDAILFDSPSKFSAPLGDDFNNFEEYRGIVYTATVGGPLQHLRLNPYRKDLFIRGEGFEEAYPFAIGDALKNAGVDVHDTTHWGHDATVCSNDPTQNATFFTYYTTGSIAGIVNQEVTVDTDADQSTMIISQLVTGIGTNWITTWPAYEWEFRLGGSGNPWTPIIGWGDAGTLQIDGANPQPSGGSGPYAIRMSLPHINVVTARLDKKAKGAFTAEDGYLQMISVLAPSAGNPMGSRKWVPTTMGKSIRSQTPGEYGLATILAIPLDHYFGDRPYQKGTVWTGNGWDKPAPQDMKLSPLRDCEDQKDSGAYVDGYTDESMGILLGNTPNGAWDGDKVLPREEWAANGNLSPVDVNNDGLVELPRASDPNAVNPAHQYTKEKVLQFSLTHEIIHVLAGPWHSEDSKCVMYKSLKDWKRDDFLCDWYRSLLRIQNKPRN